MSRIHHEAATMATIRAAYKRVAPDGHWFDPETMVFFGSRLPHYGLRIPGGFLFVSSEKYGRSGERRYSVRILSTAGADGAGEAGCSRAQCSAMDTIGEFMEHPTRAAAVARARSVADVIATGGVTS